MKKYILLGVIIKMVVMVFTVHHDLIFIWERPGVFWLNFGRIGDYYSPLTYLTFALLSPLYQLSNYFGYWVLKLPNLLVDFLILLILLKMFKDKKRKVLTLWWLNPVVIYVAYAMGTHDILPTLFLVLAVFFAKSNTLSVISIGIASAYKTIPAVLILPTALFLKVSLKNRIRLICWALIIPILLGLIFAINSGLDVPNSHFPKGSASIQFSSPLSPSSIWKYLMIIISILGYVLINVKLISKRKEINKNAYGDLLFTVLSLSFVAIPINSLHRYLPLIPFLVFVTIKRNYSLKIFWAFNFLLIFGYLYTWNLEWGLVSNKFPQVKNFQALRELVAPVFNYENLAFLFRATSDLILIWLALKSLKCIGIYPAKLFERKTKYVQF